MGPRFLEELLGELHLPPGRVTCCLRSRAVSERRQGMIVSLGRDPGRPHGHCLGVGFQQVPSHDGVGVKPMCLKSSFGMSVSQVVRLSGLSIYQRAVALDGALTMDRHPKSLLSRSVF